MNVNHCYLHCNCYEKNYWNQYHCLQIMDLDMFNLNLAKIMIIIETLINLFINGKDLLDCFYLQVNILLFYLDHLDSFSSFQNFHLKQLGLSYYSKD